MASADGPVGVYDIEARDWVRYVVGATWIEGETAPVYHTSIDRLYDHMRASGVRRWYAHNGGNYDVLFLLGRLVADGASIVCQGSRVIKASVGRGAASTTFLDSVKLLPARLAQIGDAVGLPKLDADYSDIRDTDETRTYLARDCEILLRGLDRFRALAGEIPGTLASWGIKRIKGYGHKSLAPELNNAFRRAVFGGRTEVFRESLEGEIYACDIRSSYARSALDALPGKYLGNRRGISGLHLYYGEVTVPASCPIPPLPCRVGERVYFPTGSWVAWVCEPEMEILREAGGDMAIWETHTFAPSTAAAKFARFAWDQRQEAKDGSFERLFWKCALNWTFGKFSEGRGKWRVRQLDAEAMGRRVELEATWPGDQRMRPFWTPNDLWMLYQETVPAIEHTAAGAWITSHARARLWRALTAGRADPAYCDTDSIVCDYRPPLDYGPACGQWAIEDHFTGVAEFPAPKLYHLTDVGNVAIRARAKGFSGLGVSPEESDRVDRDTVIALAAGRTVPIKRLVKCREIARDAARLGMDPRVYEGEKGLSPDREDKRAFTAGRSVPFPVSHLTGQLVAKGAAREMRMSRRRRVSAQLRRWGGVYAPPLLAGGEWARLYDSPWPGVLRRRPGGVTPALACERLMQLGYPIQLDETGVLIQWLEDERRGLE